MTARQADQVWKAALGELQLQVTRPSYETWLRDTTALDYSEGRFVVGTPNAFVAEMLEQRMYSLISQVMERVAKGPLEVSFQVAPNPAHRNEALPETMSFVGQPDNAQPNNEGTVEHPTAWKGSAQAHRSRFNGTSALNPRYEFDSFVIGRSNELAHAAAWAVSENPGTAYNPLVIYSDVGLGKTHLLHAIGHRARSHGHGLIYATTEEFTNQYIKAIRERQTEEFRNYYRTADLLLLDDIQFLLGKEQTQEGFFHTFNALHMASRQIVITSDRPITALKQLNDRVRSRLSGGLVVDTQPPDLETRLAILRSKARLMGQAIPPDVIDFIGRRIHKNVRVMEGSLNRVVAYSRVAQDPITVDLAGRALADDSDSTLGRVSPGTILKAVSDCFSISVTVLTGPKRDTRTTLARHIAMYLLSADASLGPTMIGRIIGDRHHTTALNGCRRIARRLPNDVALQREVIAIRENLSLSTPSS